jgi:putative transposase
MGQGGLGARDVLPMTIVLAAALLHVVLPFIPCGVLSVWLWRHWRSPPARRPMRRPALSPDAAHRAKPDWVRNKVIYLAAHLGTCRQVAMAFNRQHGAALTIGKTYAWETMRKHAAEVVELRRAIRRTPPRAMPVGDSWALDLTFFVSRPGLTFTVLGILDAGSRKLLRLKMIPRKCAFTILGHLLLAIAEHGLPRSVRTDNESMFCSHIWALTLRALAIAHRRGPPAQPWHNGRIERFFGTLKQTLDRKWSGSAVALQDAMERFADFYNRGRPHQSLGGLTPQEAWEGLVMRDVEDVPTRGRRLGVEAAMTPTLRRHE